MKVNNNLEKSSGYKSTISGIFGLIAFLGCVATAKAAIPQEKKFSFKNDYKLTQSSYQTVVKNSQLGFYFLGAKKDVKDVISKKESKKDVVDAKKIQTEKQVETEVVTPVATAIEKKDTFERVGDFVDKHKATIFKICTLVFNIVVFFIGLFE